MIRYIKLILCAAALTAAVIPVLRGQENVPNQGVVRAPAAVQSYRTAFFDLKRYDCPATAGRRINRRFLSQLLRLPNISLVDGEGKGGAPCHESGCAVAIGRSLGSDRAIYGFVSVSRNVEKKRLGTAGAEKYILKVETRETYRIGIKLVDVQSGALLASLNEETGPEGLEGAVDRMVAALGPHYRPREATQAEEQACGEPPIEPQKETPPSAGEEAAGSPVRYHASLCFSFMVPAGSFGDVSGFSLGNVVEGSVTGLFMERTDMRLSLGYYYLSSTRGDVSSYRSLCAALS
ncbi:MAG: hypothetical protein JXA20_00515, partial [Spirochaetes bacterium]|nr:hypothetical protein [Spirochaetota bacterium]